MGSLDQAFKRTELIKDMYMQINNIAQAFAIAILIDALAERFMNSGRTLVVEDFYVINLALTSFFISIIFWTRYYFDTEIIRRSFSVRSVTWFFLYIVSEGFSFKQITEPQYWLLSTGIFLFFGFGFYFLNLAEIPRSAKKPVQGPRRSGSLFRKILAWPKATYVYLLMQKREYRDWQKERLFDLFILFLLTLVGSWLVAWEFLLVYPISVITLLFAAWQLSKSRDYRKFGFLDNQ